MEVLKQLVHYAKSHWFPPERYLGAFYDLLVFFEEEQTINYLKKFDIKFVFLTNDEARDYLPKKENSVCLNKKKLFFTCFKGEKPQNFVL